MSLAFPPKVSSIAADAARLLEQSPSATGLIRVGVDVVSISEFATTMASKAGDAFLRTRFTEAERAYCEGRPDRLAARWAAKEAVAKAIGTGFRGLRPSQIEIVHQPWGEPTVNAVGDLAWPNGSAKWRWSLSLAHEGDAAVAVALALTAAAVDQIEGDDTAPTALLPERRDTDVAPRDTEGGHL